MPFSKKEMNMMRANNLHIAMYPWFALGHLTSFLHLANKLAERGHKVSYFVPSKTQPKLTHHNHHPNLITFIPIIVPPVHGLPDGAETTNDVPTSARPLIMTAMDLTQPTIEAHLAHLKPNFVFYDFTHWLPGVARKHGIKSIYYATIYIVSIAYFSLKARNLPPHHQLTENDLVDPPPGFPSPAIRLEPREARALADIVMMDFGGGLTLGERHRIGTQECDVVCFKTCREMEEPYRRFVEEQFNKPVLLAGPVVPESPASTLDEVFDSWLKGFSDGSVVYCALGSEAVLEKHQFQELLLGLELTGRPFLGALKPPSGYETMESAIPEGFAERTKGRGMVYGGWVQQRLILKHPSIGCFVTHCGEGSMSEAMVSKCQIVMMPQGVDQFVNARMMSLELKIGMEINKRKEDGFFTRNAICEGITMVMEVDSEVGRQVRINHAKWRDFLLRDGLEESYISCLLQNLQDLLE